MSKIKNPVLKSNFYMKRKTQPHSIVDLVEETEPHARSPPKTFSSQQKNKKDHAKIKFSMLDKNLHYLQYMISGKPDQMMFKNKESLTNRKKLQTLKFGSVGANPNKKLE